MKHYENSKAGNYSFGEGDFFLQPHKFVTRKMKKDHHFKKAELDSESLHKNRHAYNRAADKNLTRSQLLEPN